MSFSTQRCPWLGLMLTAVAGAVPAYAINVALFGELLQNGTPFNGTLAEIEVQFTEGDTTVIHPVNDVVVQFGILHAVLDLDEDDLFGIDLANAQIRIGIRENPEDELEFLSPGDITATLHSHRTDSLSPNATALGDVNLRTNALRNIGTNRTRFTGTGGLHIFDTLSVGPATSDPNNPNPPGNATFVVNPDAALPAEAACTFNSLGDAVCIDVNANNGQGTAARFKGDVGVEGSWVVHDPTTFASTECSPGGITCLNMMDTSHCVIAGSTGVTVIEDGRIDCAVLSAAVKNFRIDHPLDPENKYLVHASIESAEMLNLYSGNVTTDASGFATVTLPEWFEALNTDFRYQLTVVGTFAQAIVAQEIEGNRFVIRTSAPKAKVSWQVTGVRHDRYARENPMKVESDK